MTSSIRAPSPAPSWSAEAPAAGAPAPPAQRALIVLLPALVAGGLAAYQLGGRSLWLDEGATIAIASQHGAALWHGIAHDGGNMLAYYLLIHVWIGLFGAGEVVVRLPSVLAVASTAGLTAEIGWRLLGRVPAALIAGGLTAVSLPLVFWGQDARGYALMVALATGSFLAFLLLLARPSVGRAVAYTIVTVLALYVGFDAVLVTFAQALLLAARRDRARIVLACLGCVAIGCVPLVVLAVQRGRGQLFWVPTLSGTVLGQAGAVLTSAGLEPNFPGGAWMVLTGAVSGLLILAGLWRSVGDRSMWPVAAWLLVPIALGVAALLAGEPIELARTWILLIPAVALLLAAVLADPRLPRLVAWGGVAAVIALRLLVLWPTFGVSPENWRAAADHVLGSSRAGDCVAFYPQDGRMVFDYYVRGRPAASRLRPVLPARPWSFAGPYVERYAVPSPPALSAISARCPRLWLIASHEGQRAGPRASQLNLARYRRLRSSLEQRYPRVVPSRFGYAAVVHVILFSR